MKLLVTGSSGVGKTTLVEALAYATEGARGFVTQELKGAGGRREGFDLVTVGREGGEVRGALARLGGQGPKVSQYSVITAVEIGKACVSDIPLANKP